MQNIIPALFILIVFTACGGEQGSSPAGAKEKTAFTETIEISRGEKLFNDKCLICHIKNKPGGKYVQSLSAPPMTRVVMHVRRAFTDSLTGIINSEKAMDFITDYVLYPAEEKALCEPSRIKSFGLMPSLKGSVSTDELELISGYMVEDFPLDSLMPQWRGGRK